MTRTERDRTTLYVGSTRRMVETLVGMSVAGDPWQRAVAEYAFENGTAPDLSSLGRLVELREAVREFATNYPLTEYDDWKNVKRALKRAGGKQ